MKNRIYRVCINILDSSAPFIENNLYTGRGWPRKLFSLHFKSIIVLCSAVERREICIYRVIGSCSTILKEDIGENIWSGKCK